MKATSLNILAWQKIKKNRLALFSLCYIVLSIFTGVFAVVISPDSSPNANEMHIELATLPPGTRIQFLEIPKPPEVENFSKPDFGHLRIFAISRTLGVPRENFEIFLNFRHHTDVRLCVCLPLF